jgi:hypothetical protein
MWTMFRPQAGHLLNIYICIRVSNPESSSPDPDPDLDLDFISDLDPGFLRPKIVIFFYFSFKQVNMSIRNAIEIFYRTFKLQENASALAKKHLALQNMIYFSSFLDIWPPWI